MLFSFLCIKNYVLRQALKIPEFLPKNTIWTLEVFYWFTVDYKHNNFDVFIGYWNRNTFISRPVNLRQPEWSSRYSNYDYNCLNEKIFKTCCLYGQYLVIYQKKENATKRTNVYREIMSLGQLAL